MCTMTHDPSSSRFFQDLMKIKYPRYFIYTDIYNKHLVTNSLYCGTWRKISMSRCDLDLERTMSNVQPIRAISIYYNTLYVQVIKLMDPLFFELSCTETGRHTHTRTHTHTPTHTSTQTDMSTLYFVNCNYNK